MMRSITSAGIVFLSLLQMVCAQDMSKLTVPASPAFSILNFEPSAVMRPTNARDLAADVLNAFDKDGKLLLNLGLEVMPYWLKSHPTLKRSTYLNPKPHQAFLQSLSFSAATVKDSATGDNKLGSGFRFKLFNGKPVDELSEADAELRTKATVVAIINGLKNVVGSAIHTKQEAITAITSALLKRDMAPTVIADVKNDAAAIENGYTDAPADMKLFLENLLSLRVEAYSGLARRVSDLIYQRQGFVLEFAGAAGFNSSQNNSLERTGIWSNASYYVSPDDLFTLTARFMNRNTDTTLRNFDVGLGFLKKTSRYNISLEGMFRWYRAEIPDRNAGNVPIIRLEKDFTYRLAVQSAYMISKDISINLNFGKDFNSPFLAGNGMFSIFGFNYSLFSKGPAELTE